MPKRPVAERLARVIVHERQSTRILRRVERELRHVLGLAQPYDRRGDLRSRGHVELARHLLTVIANQCTFGGRKGTR